MVRGCRVGRAKSTERSPPPPRAAPVDRPSPANRSDGYGGKNMRARPPSQGNPENHAARCKVPREWGWCVSFGRPRSTHPTLRCRVGRARSTERSPPPPLRAPVAHPSPGIRSRVYGGPQIRSRSTLANHPRPHRRDAKIDAPLCVVRFVRKTSLNAPYFADWQRWRWRSVSAAPTAGKKARTSEREENRHAMPPD